MAGTAWKATGTVLIILGAVLGVLGIGGAVFGAVGYSSVMSDAAECEQSPFSGCDSDVYEARFEVAAISAAVGGAALAIGLVLVIAGVVLVFVGKRRAAVAREVAA